MGDDAMSGRERQVLELAKVGLADDEIARRLRITAGAVQDHVTAAMYKSGTASRDALVVLGVVRAIVEQRGTGVDCECGGVG
jgi:DNA-binding CsgD family transcriptional regulator